MKQLSFLFIIFLLPFSAFSQQYWNDIVVPNDVQDIAETNSTVWMATHGGVIAVDKTTNTVSQFTKAKDGIPSNWVETVALDNSGNLWIGTYTMDLARFDGNTWTTVNYPSSLNINATYSITFDQNNTAWIGTANGLLKYDGTSWELFNSSNTSVAFFNLVWDVHIDQQGDVIAVTDNTILKFDGTNFTDLNSGNSLNMYGDIQFSSTDSDKLLFSTHLDIVGIYDGGLTLYSYPDFPHGDILAVYFDENDIPHISIKDHGVHKLDNGTWTSASLPTTTLDENSISAMFTDSDNHLWLANGADFIKVGNSNTQTIDINLSPLPSNLTNKVHHKGTDVFIVNETIISRYQEGIGWSSIPSPTQNTFLPSDDFRHFAVTDNGNYWVAGRTNELHYWNGQNWMSYNDQNSSFPLAIIEDLAWDEQNQALWLATSQGVIRFKNQQWTIFDNSNTIFSEQYARSIVLKNDKVFVGINGYLYQFDGNTWSDISPTNTDAIISLYVDQQDNIWTGHWSGGVSRYENNTWSDVSQFQSIKVRDITQGVNDNLYFATDNEGLFAFDEMNWTQFTEENSDLTFNTINDLSVDSYNQLWIATDGGISVYHPEGTVSNENITTVEAIDFNVFPNPIRNHATITFTLENSQSVALEIYNVNGQLVQSIINNETLQSGEHLISFEKGDLVNGIYLMRLRTENSIQTMKLFMQK